MQRNTYVTIVTAYRQLLAEIDVWFARCQEAYPQDISCGKGCSGCCRGLFDITMLDAFLLKSGFAQLGEATRAAIAAQAQKRLSSMQNLWPEFSHPFTLNHRQEQEIEALMATDNDTPCVLLDVAGRCLLYDYRPMTCRLHGLPLIDVSGEVMERDYCTMNFTGSDPLQLIDLRGEFNRILHQEVELGREFTSELLGKAVSELDTFIPAAVLIDFTSFDWQQWFAGYDIKT